MQINVRFSRFYHSVLNDLLRKSNKLVFRDLMDTRSNGAFSLTKHEDFNDLEDLKQLLKILNVNYSVNEKEDKKTSTKDVDNKELLSHLEWIFKLASDNAITLDVIEAEWQYLINYYK